MFVSNITIAALSVTILSLELSSGWLAYEAALVVAVYSVSFLAPVGSFLLLVGLARSLRRPREVALPPIPGERTAAVSTRPFGINPFHLALGGAALGLLGSLGGLASNVARTLLVTSIGIGSIQDFLVFWALIGLLTTSVVATGTLVAFIGVALEIRERLP